MNHLRLARPALLGTDLLGSPLRKIGEDSQALTYTPFGHAPESAPQTMGFTGQVKEPASGYYLLGNGYRPYSPSLIRFTAADELSPFDRGGLNSYAYCTADPINHDDPSGQMGLGALGKLLRGNADEALAALATTTRPVRSASTAPARIAGKYSTSNEIAARFRASEKGIAFSNKSLVKDSAELARELGPPTSKELYKVRSWLRKIQRPSSDGLPIIKERLYLRNANVKALASDDQRQAFYQRKVRIRSQFPSEPWPVLRSGQ
jgi:RHS repeat-associated protein